LYLFRHVTIMSYPASPATIKELEEVFRVWETQAQTGVPEKLAALITDDCILHQAGMPPFAGKQACLALLRTYLMISTDCGTQPLPDHVLTMKMDPQRVFVDNVENPRVVISAHTFIQKMPAQTGGEPLHCQSLSVWRRQPNQPQLYLTTMVSNSLMTPPTPQLEGILGKIGAAAQTATASHSTAART